MRRCMLPGSRRKSCKLWVLSNFSDSPTWKPKGKHKGTNNGSQPPTIGDSQDLQYCGLLVRKVGFPSINIWKTVGCPYHGNSSASPQQQPGTPSRGRFTKDMGILKNIRALVRTANGRALAIRAPTKKSP